MIINKAALAIDGDNVRLSMPMTKVDKANRIVSGWASLNNLDTQKDRVLAEASKKAFARFRGNIREMHQPIAVGKMVKFREDKFFDEKTGQIYDGIFVDVYVSKGAESTWEKVLDGTLTGFSIGGNILDFEQEFDKAMGDSVRVVKDYELVELSLVDSPANPLANVFSIHKAAGGTFVDGFIAKNSSESVWYCKEDGVAKTSNDESVACPNGHAMSNIGLVEYADDTEKATKLAEVVTAYNSSHETAEQELPATTEGGVDVADEEKEVVAPGETVPAEVAPAAEGAAATEEASSVEEVTPEEEVAEGTEKAAEVSEVEVEEPDFAKMTETLEALKGVLESGLEKNRTEVVAEVAKATEGFNSKVTELETKHSELVTKFDAVVAEIAALKGTVETVEKSTAVKKSSDLGGSTEEPVKKAGSSEWGGVFVPKSGSRFLSVNSLEDN